MSFTTSAESEDSWIAHVDYDLAATLACYKNPQK
jgi:hypothetical protein